MNGKFQKATYEEDSKYNATYFLFYSKFVLFKFEVRNIVPQLFGYSYFQNKL